MNPCGLLHLLYLWKHREVPIDGCSLWCCHCLSHKWLARVRAADTQFTTDALHELRSLHQVFAVDYHPRHAPPIFHCRCDLPKISEELVAYRRGSTLFDELRVDLCLLHAFHR